MSETTMINHAANHGELIASDRVEGTAVYNRQGEKLGKISNFMVDKMSGRSVMRCCPSAAFWG